MKEMLAAAIAVAAVLVLFVVARSAGQRARGRAGGSARARAAKGAPAVGAAQPGGELVAVIAAAVAAASGMDASSFRIVGVQPSSGETWRRGLNTPVWGHVDRFNRGEGL